MLGDNRILRGAGEEEADMGTGAAFLSLLMTAQTVGVDLGKLEPPAAVPMVQTAPKPVPQSPQAIVSVPGLLRELYEAALHALFTPVEYAVLYEDGALAPAAITLLREDREGRLWATYKPVAEMGKMHWFLAVNGVMFGMKLEGGGTGLLFPAGAGEGVPGP